MSDIIEWIFRTLFQLIVEYLFFLTGEVLLFLVTLGRHRVRGDWYLNDGPMGWTVLATFSAWLGGAFWLGVAMALHRVF